MSGKPAVIAVVAMLVLTTFASVPVVAAESVTVETEPATNVTSDAATLQGNLSSLEGANNASVWFEYWVSGDEANSSTTETMSVAETGPFSIDVRDLESNTTYTVVAHAETENASSVGSEVSFSTDPAAALAVETGDASDITDTSATLSGQLSTLEGYDNASVWFLYWQQGDPDNTTRSPAQTLESAGAFSASVTGLANNTTYVFEAHAVTNNDSDTGERNNFTTLDRSADLAVETLAASAVENSSATLNGQLTGMDGEDEADVWFEYWVKGDPANATSTSIQNMSAPGSFSEGVSGLQNDTNYVYVAHARANNTTVTGDQVEFRTTTGSNETDEPVWDGQGPFGQWVSNLLRGLGVDSGTPLGQQLSDLVVKNNPGSEHRSDKANPGGNGPPDRAVNKSDNEGNGSNGPPDHAVNKSDNKGNDSNGPPDHAQNDSEESGSNSASGNETTGNNGNNGQGNGNGGNGNSGQGNGNGGNGNNGQGNGKSLARPAF